jgi:penicillin-binding protein 1A
LLRFLTTTLSVLLLVAVVGFFGAATVFWYFGRGLPDYQQLEQYEPSVTTRLYASNGLLFAEYAQEKRLYVPIEAIPKRILYTFLAAEDKNFYDHIGIDFTGIMRAVIQNIDRKGANKRPVGASTITQQVAKNFLLSDISHELSYARKLKEAILAFRIESAFSKDHILELYLNEIYLGAGYGVAAAALNYFNKSLDQLTIAEAAFLAGLPKAPSRYNPIRYPERALARRNYVIGRMVEEDLITPEEGKQAKSEPIIVRNRDISKVVRADYFAEEVRRTLLKQFGVGALYKGGLTVKTTLVPHLQDIADQTLRNALTTYDRNHGYHGPVTRISITNNWPQTLSEVKKPAGIGKWELAVVLDTNTTVANIGFENGHKGEIPLEELKWARQFISSNRRGPVITHPKAAVSKGDVILVEHITPQEGEEKIQTNQYALRQIPKVSGGLVAIDPNTGRVLALSGGFDYQISQYNRATQALRQPGSAFKPFVYAAALESGLTPSSIFMDSPFTISLGAGLGTWSPGNYERDFRGPTTLRVGLEKSRNIVTVRIVHERVGISHVIEMAKRLGVVDDMPKQLAMVLGAGETTVMRITAAYGSFVNGGKLITPTLIDRVQDRYGHTVWQHETSKCVDCVMNEPWSNQKMPKLVDTRKDVLDPAIAYQMVSLLNGVVERGTGSGIKRVIQRDDLELAAKTGTTNDYKDGWTVGFSPNLVVGLYIGFDEPRTLGEKNSGGRIAAPFFGEFMKEARKDQPGVPFRIPPGIRLVRVDRMSGLKASRGDKNAIIEAFRADDTIPTERAYAADENPGGEAGGGESIRSTSNSNMTGTGGIY